MSKQEKPLSVAAQKKVIAKAMSMFESRLMKASNAFHRVCVLNDMQELVEAEILQWISLTETNDNGSDTLPEETLTEAGKHISDLRDLINTFNKYRLEDIEDALKIQQAMINSHLISSPVITKK